MDFTSKFPPGFRYDAFRARLKAAIRLMGFRLWSDFCRYANVGTRAAQLAVEGCEFDVRPQLEMLRELAAALGRDVEWLLTGKISEDKFTITERERIHALVNDFLYHEEVDEEDRGRFHEFMDKKISALQSHTAHELYRKGLPQTLRDVGFCWEEFIVFNA